MVNIFAVEDGSWASRAGVLAGDVLISINNNPINDVLDYRFYLAERVVTLLCSRGNSEYSVTVKKGEYDDIGLEFETPLMDEKHSCNNKCIFCFIDQNPKQASFSQHFQACSILCPEEDMSEYCFSSL